MDSMITWDVMDEKYASTGYEILPPAVYKCMISSIEMQTPASGEGKMIKVVFEVLDGDYRGRKHTERWNVINANPKAELASRAAFQRLALACGYQGTNQPKVVEDLLGKVVNANIEVVPPAKGREQYGPQNKVKGYADATPPASVKPSTPPSATGKPDWMK